MTLIYPRPEELVILQVHVTVHSPTFHSRAPVLYYNIQDVASFNNPSHRDLKEWRARSH